MPKIIAFVSAAGSTGKTSTCVNLAAMAALAGTPVTIVDCDSQANATQWLGQNHWDVTSGAADLILGKKPFEDCRATHEFQTPEWQKVRGRPQQVQIGLLPGGFNLTKAEEELKNDIAFFKVFRNALSQIPSEHLVFLDLKAGLHTRINVAALHAAQFLICPVFPGGKETSSLTTLGQQLHSVNNAYAEDDPSKRTKIGKIIPTSMPSKNAGKAYQQVLSELRESETFGPFVSHAKVRKTVDMEKGFQQKKPVAFFDKPPALVSDFEDLYKELLADGIL